MLSTRQFPSAAISTTFTARRPIGGRLTYYYAEQIRAELEKPGGTA